MSKKPEVKTLEGMFKCPWCKKNTSIKNFDSWQKRIIDGKEKWIFHRKGIIRVYFGGFNDERWMESYSEPGWFGYAHIAINYAYSNESKKYKTAELCWTSTGGETQEQWDDRGENWVCQHCKFSSSSFTSFILK